MQYRRPVGAGPSSKTWPRWAPQWLHTTSLRTMNRLRSASVLTFWSSCGRVKLGQPVPESNLLAESNSGAPQQTHLYDPSALLFQ